MDKHNEKNWGAVVKDFRDARGLLQNEVAKIMGVSRAHLSMAENGEHNLAEKHIDRLVQYLEISKSDLERVSELEKIEQVKNRSVDEGKFKSLMLYLLNKVGGRPNVGETVLYKLLYFIEKEHYLAHQGKLLANLQFIKRPYGPVPAGFRDMVTGLIQSGDVSMVKTEYHGFPQKKYLPNRSLKDIRTSAGLTQNEMEIIDRVVDEYADFNATTISEISHKEKTWRETLDNQLISFDLLQEK